MAEESKCPICGESTFKFYGNYRKDKLCSKHATELKNEKIGILDQYECFGGMFVDTTIFINNETGEVLNEIIDDDISDALKQCYAEWPRNNYNNCIICNKKSNGYAFCKECYKTKNFLDLQKVLFEKSESINEISTDEITQCQEDTSNKEKSNEEKFINEHTLENQNNVVIINETNKSKCITCGRQTDGLLFCSNCYYKYKNKELLFKITNCTNVELLDESYEGRYTCPDGHIVKSKSERDIDRYLFEKNIPHAYEIELSYGPSENEILHPDFFLPHYLGKDKHVYIEHWGYNDNNISYTKTKKFKLPIYKQLGITLICTDEKKDASKIDAVLDRKLNKKFIKENEINFDE